MVHEPSRLLRDAEIASHLVRTDAVLAIRDYPNRGKPLVQAEPAILKDRPDLGRKLSPRMFLFAFPHAARADEANVRTATGWAMHARWPAQAHHHFVSHARISKVLDRLDKGLGFVFHGPNLPTESSIL